MKAFSEILLWLAPGAPSAASRGFVLALAAAALVLGVLVHRSMRFPGPVSTYERRAARASWLRRTAGMAAYWAVAITWITALVALGLSPQRPTILLLESRAQLEALPEEQTRCPALRVADSPASGAAAASPGDEGNDELPATPLRTLGRGDTAVDLGPMVDAVVDSCGRLCQQYSGNAADRRALAKLVRDTVLAASPTLVRSENPPRAAAEENGKGAVAAPPPLQEVLETIEISVLQLAVSRFNAREVRILPGRSYESRLTWDVARTFVSRPGLPVRLCGRDSEELPREPVIVRLSPATFAADGRLSGWALVEGRFQPGAKEQSLALALETWGPAKAKPSADASEGVVPAPTAHLAYRISPDELSSRLVRLCFGPGCQENPPSNSTFADLDRLRSAAVAAGAAVRLRSKPTANAPDVWAPVRLASAEDRPPDLVLATARGPALEPSGSGNWPRWQRLFDEIATADRYRAFRDELQAMGLRMPRLVISSSDARAPTLMVTNDALAMAADAAAARRAFDAAGTATPSGLGRVREVSALGPTTVFSLLELPLSPSLGKAAGKLGALAHVEQGEPAHGSAAEVARHQVLMREGFDAPGRPFLVLGMEGIGEALTPGTARYEPVTALALLRAIAWGAQRIRDGTTGSSRLTAQRKPVSQVATPLMTPADAYEAVRSSARRQDATLLCGLGLCLLATAAIVVRRAPRPTAKP